MAGASLILLLALVGTSVALQCYGINEYTNDIITLKGKSYCCSVYDTRNEKSFFTGMSVNPHRLAVLVLVAKEQECHLMKEDYIEAYMCMCFKDMCNFPFTFDEFIKRGKTLAPVSRKNNNVV